MMKSHFPNASIYASACNKFFGDKHMQYHSCLINSASSSEMYKLHC